MRVTRPTTPVYCSECDAGKALLIRFQNPGVVQQGGFALCDKHAEELGQRLIRSVHRARLQSRSRTTRET